MEEIDLALFTGVDIPIPECQLIIHQPTIKEISMVGEKKFLFGIQTLCVDRDELANRDKIDLSNTSNFQIFMTMMKADEMKDHKENVKIALSLIVPNSQVIFTPRSLLLNLNGQSSMIDEGNFDIFQKTLRQVFCLTKKAEEFNPVNDAANRFLKKKKKGRERVAALKGDTTGSIYARQISILSVGLKIPPHVLNGYTMYQISDLSERYNL